MSLYVWDFQSGKKIKMQRYDKDTSLWYKAMKRVLLGLWLSSCSIHIMKLRIILPMIGILLATLGFRMLRKSHPSFERALWLNLLRSAFLVLAMLIHFSIYRRLFVFSAIGLAGLIIYGLLSWMVLKQLQKGLAFVLKECDYNAPKELNEYIIRYTYYLTLALFFTFLALPRTILLPTLQPFELPTLVPRLIDYIFFFKIAYITYQLFGLLLPVVKDDYVLPPIRERLSDLTLTGIFSLCFILAFFLSFFLRRYPMKWREMNDTGTEMNQISEKLVKKGVPKPILKDLSGEELLLAESASNIRVYTTEDGNDKEKIRFTIIFFQPFASDQLRVIRHFQWLGNPKFLDMEGLYILINRSDPFYFEGRASGRVLCRRKEKTLVSPYFYLDRGAPNRSKEEFAEDNELFATFSFPKNAEEARGYIAYNIAGILPKDEDHLRKLEYCHQERRVEPIITPSDVFQFCGIFTDPGFSKYEEKDPLKLNDTK